MDEVWWNGPDFLKCPEELQPINPGPLENDEKDIHGDNKTQRMTQDC